MKKIITLFILIFCICKINAQLDTLSYLKQFELNKANYIGQPFSKLLNEMTQIQPKTVWSISTERKKNISANTRFKFTSIDLSFHNVITLLIKWQDPIPRDQTKFYEQKNAFYFTNEEKVFYGSKIIKDIIVYR